MSQNLLKDVDLILADIGTQAKKRPNRGTCKDVALDKNYLDSAIKKTKMNFIIAPSKNIQILNMKKNQDLLPPLSLAEHPGTGFFHHIFLHKI